MIAVWPNVRRMVKPPRSVPGFVVRVRIDPPRLALIRSSRGLEMPAGLPLRTRRMASARVDFPLPRGPITQIKPAGSCNERSDKNPPVTPICSIAQSDTWDSPFQQDELDSMPLHANDQPALLSLTTPLRRKPVRFVAVDACIAFWPSFATFCNLTQFPSSITLPVPRAQPTCRGGFQVFQKVDRLAACGIRFTGRRRGLKAPPRRASVRCLN